MLFLSLSQNAHASKFYPHMVYNACYSLTYYVLLMHIRIMCTLDMHVAMYVGIEYIIIRT